MYLTQLDPAFLAVESESTPSLDLFFSATKELDSRITFTRASVGTYIDSAGALQTASSGVARFTHNPSTLASLGLLVEESRINILLNSATLSTQSVTTTATAYTLSFTGTGTITLSGTSTAGPLAGTGTGEANRVSLTFTPTAGTLTLTVSGTVTNAQLEAGSFRTSYIPTTGSQVTRAADAVSMTSTNFTSWFNSSAGTLSADGVLTTASGSRRLATFGGTGLGAGLRVNGTTSTAIWRTPTNYDASTGTVAAGNIKHVMSWSDSTMSAAANGGTVGTSTPPTPLNAAFINIGSSDTGFDYWNGTISRIRFYRRRFPNAALQTITT
jgi:hypothetical protein